MVYAGMVVGFHQRSKRASLEELRLSFILKFQLVQKIMDAQVVYEASKNKLTYIAIENFGGSSCPEKPKWAGIIGK